MLLLSFSNCSNLIDLLPPLRSLYGACFMIDAPFPFLIVMDFQTALNIFSANIYQRVPMMQCRSIVLMCFILESSVAVPCKLLH
jgi:hypothetical protein